MTPTTRHSIHGFRIASGPGDLGHLVAGLRALLSRAVSGEEIRALVLLAVEEAAVNVLEHGYGGASGRPLWVRLVPEDSNRFAVVLRDRAPGVDVTRIPPGDLKELARQKASRGRGLAMMHLLTRELRHRPRPGGGNELTLQFDRGHLTRVIEDHLRDAA